MAEPGPAPWTKRHVGLKEVAERAGVSMKTVSNVVHGSERVRLSTRQRVEESISALGYRPNLAARSLRRSPLGAIAIQIPDLLNAYFFELAEHVTRIAAERGRRVMLAHPYQHVDSEAALVASLRPLLIDGAILNPLSLDREELEALSAGLHIVLIGEREFPGLYDHVSIDNEGAARQATEHLLSLGRRRPAAIGLEPNAEAGPTVVGRWKGFMAATEAVGLRVAPEWVRPGIVGGRYDGLRHVRELLSAGLRPDAVFCYSDVVAMGVLRGLHDAGLRVPEDVAVVAIDGIGEGETAVPSLTSISPDKKMIAEVAVRLLLERIDGARTGPGEEFRAPHRLEVRESTVRA